MPRPKAKIDWEQAGNDPKEVYIGDEIYLSLIQDKTPMSLNNEKEFQFELVKYLDDIFEKLQITAPAKIEINKDVNAGGKRVKYDIYITHEDNTRSIIECKYDKDVSPGMRLINQVKGIGQMMLYNEIHKDCLKTGARMFLADEKPEQYSLRLLSDLNMGFISLKNGRIFTVSPY